MRIHFDNVNFESTSGPNNFAYKLASELTRIGNQVTSEMPDAQLSLIQTYAKLAPVTLRLDGIYFNSDQDWNGMNRPIADSYNNASAVIVQSEFNKKLIEKYFNTRDNIHVINNGTDLKLIDSVPPAVVSNYSRENIWLCASSWRPHKRLDDNIRYFLETAPDTDVLLIAGQNAVFKEDPRIFYLGDLTWQQLISAMKTSSRFIHLAWLDHCPNVVVDARASGCHVVCSSSGGTEEIAGPNSTIIEEDPWDFSPVKLYSPPSMDFSRARSGQLLDASIDIELVARRYLDVLKSTVGEI